MSNRQSKLFALVLLLALLAIGVAILLPPAAPPPPAVAASVPATAPAVLAPLATFPTLIIKKATYGDLPDGASVDVTQILADKVKDAHLTIAATNDLAGDPAPNIVKKLRVSYTYNNIPATGTVEENGTLSLPPRLVITHAEYGDLPAGGKNIVTQRVAEKVKGDTLSIEATNDNFDDPASGIVKTLRVEYTFDNAARVKVVGENETLTISNTGE